VTLQPYRMEGIICRFYFEASPVRIGGGSFGKGSVVSINNKTNRGRHDRANRKWVVSRRVFLRASALSVIGAGLSQLSCAALPCGGCGKGRGRSRFGIVTDCHYADMDSKGSRHYRESLEKLGECVELMNSEKVDFLIELGDFKDEKPPGNEQQTIGYLRAIEEVYQGFDGPTYHVLGNHDMDSISKEQFLSNVENTGIDSLLIRFGRSSLHRSRRELQAQLQRLRPR